MKNIAKFSDTEIQISNTIINSTVISLDQLNFDKNSLLKNIEQNNAANEAANGIISGIIADIDAQISQAKSLGVVSGESIS